MGTTNLTVVVLNGEVKVAQYGQWDGYPTSAGENISSLINTIDLDKFKNAVNNCSFVNDEYVSKLWKDLGADGSGFVDLKTSNKFKKLYPEIHRDTGVDILSVIYKKNGCNLVNEIEFAADSLFCEWAYVVNLDTNCLEIYRGFNKTPLVKGERFFDLNGKSTDHYYPVKLVKILPFSDCTYECLETLENSVYNEENM